MPKIQQFSNDNSKKVQPDEKNPRRRSINRIIPRNENGTRTRLG